MVTDFQWFQNVFSTTTNWELSLKKQTNKQIVNQCTSSVSRHSLSPPPVHKRPTTSVSPPPPSLAFTIFLAASVIGHSSISSASIYTKHLHIIIFRWNLCNQAPVTIHPALSRAGNGVIRGILIQWRFLYFIKYFSCSKFTFKLNYSFSVKDLHFWEIVACC